MIILGIDPGSRRTGWGIIRVSSQQVHYLHHGVLQLDVDANMPQRMSQLYAGIQRVCSQWQIASCALEEIFVARNASSALKLGQARGVVMAAACAQDIPIAEYAARMVKKTVTGYGSADKKSVQKMIMRLLQLNCLPPSDAADALALGWCHAQILQFQTRIDHHFEFLKSTKQ